jgi:hypothetical protein
MVVSPHREMRLSRLLAGGNASNFAVHHPLALAWYPPGRILPTTSR